MYTICGPGLEVLHVGLVLDVYYMWTRTRYHMLDHVLTVVYIIQGLFQGRRGGYFSPGA